MGEEEWPTLQWLLWLLLLLLLPSHARLLAPAVPLAVERYLAALPCYYLNILPPLLSALQSMS